jgi:hypothetical protein
VNKDKKTFFYLKITKCKIKIINFFSLLFLFNLLFFQQAYCAPHSHLIFETMREYNQNLPLTGRRLKGNGTLSIFVGVGINPYSAMDVGQISFKGQPALNAILSPNGGSNYFTQNLVGYPLIGISYTPYRLTFIRHELLIRMEFINTDVGRDIVLGNATYGSSLLKSNIINIVYAPVLNIKIPNTCISPSCHQNAPRWYGDNKSSHKSNQKNRNILISNQIWY